MADLYSHSYSQRPQYHLNTNNSVVYPNSIHPASNNNGNNTPIDNEDDDSPTKSNDDSPTDSKPPQKTQSTFLTKLYALLEKPENHHMIRWDPAGDHIIVERPEQLALHVLPSVYRQSRFASFSRQLNIYGFMRKVNLRNVDPAIDDPDASTWSHPTLNRHSPPDVVANFKRRVPPRLPKPRKRQEPEMPQIPPPRSAIGMGPVPLTVPSSIGPSSPGGKSRPRGFSAPGTFTPLTQPGAATGWGGGGGAYGRSALPPLTVPTDPPQLSHAHHTQQHHGGMYSAHSAHSAHPHSGLHPLTPSDETPHGTSFSPSSYSTSGSGLGLGASHYPYTESTGNWSFSPVSNTSSSGHSGSLSSLLNPSQNNYGRTTSGMSSYPSPFSAVPLSNANHSASSLSPDSRPTTGYSVSSMSSLPYETESTGTAHTDYSRPSSSHHRPPSPFSQRPVSKGSPYSGSNPSSLRIGRARRHSQAVSPYPSPYDHHMEHEGSHSQQNLSAHQHHQQHQQQGQRPSTSPQPGGHHDSGAIPRVRSMIQLPSVDSYSFNPSQAEFAYSASTQGQQTVGGGGAGSEMDQGGWGRNVRPSTAASSISSSSQANTPPVDGGYGGESDINRFSPDFGFVPLSDSVHSYSKTTAVAV